MIKKTITITIGVFGIGIGAALCMVANFGIDPLTTFNNGLSNLFSISIGTMMIITNIVVFGLMLLVYREGIHLGTVISTFGVGISMNIFLPLFTTINADTMVSRILIAAAGILVMLLSISLYISANMGIAPWDSLGFILQKVFNMKYGTLRIIYEVTATIIGILLGAQYGLVTIILAFCLGPAIDILGKKFARLLRFN